MLGSMAWLGLERTIRLIIGLLVGSLVARHLGPEEFGNLQVALTWTALAAVFSNFGLDTILQREFAVSSTSRTSRIFNTSLGLRLMGAMLGFCIVLLSAFLHESGPSRAVLAVAAFTVFQPVGAIMELWLQSRGLNRISTCTQISVLAVGSGLRILMVYAGAGVFAFGAICAIESMVFVTVYFFISVKFGFRFSTGYISKAELKSLLSDGIPLLVSILAAAFYQKLDLLVVSRYCSPQQTGLYGVAFRLCEVAYVLPIVLATVTVPRLARAYAAGPELFRRGYEACLAVSVGVGVVLTGVVVLFAPLIVQCLFGMGYAEAVSLFQIRGVALFFLCLEIGRSMRLIQEGKTYFVMIAHILGAIVMLITCPVFVKIFGVAGGGYSFVLTMSVPGWFAALLYRETRCDAMRIAILSVRPDLWLKSAKFLSQGHLDRMYAKNSGGTNI